MAGLDDDSNALVAVDLDRFLSPASFWLPDKFVSSAWLQHGPFAFWLMNALRPRRLVELGTHHGFSYLAFCQSVRRLGLDARLFAVDTWAGDEHAGRYPEQVLRDLQAYHDPRFSDFSRLVRARFDEAVTHFDDASIDLLHVDGRHFYEDAKEDYEIWRPKLSERAVVLFHDTNVRERNFGVWRLWGELAGRHPSFEFLHGHGLGVLGSGPAIPDAVRVFFEVGSAHRDLVRETYFRLGAAVEDRVAAAAKSEAPLQPVPPPQAASGPIAAKAEPRPAPPRPAAGGHPALHIHVAAMAPQFLDVRTHLPLSELAKMPGVATSLSERTIELPRLPADQPKVVVLQRFAIKDLDRSRQVVAELTRLGWVIVSELDDHPDLFAAVHKTTVDARAWRSVSLAHAVQTSTFPLAEAIRAHNPEVQVFRNAAFTLARNPRMPSPTGPLSVFFGALNREAFSRRVGEALAPFASAHPEVAFVVVHDRAFFDALGACNKVFHPAQPYADYLRLMGGCDIALMPLEGGPGERYKSDVKWVEASGLGLATVASPVVYRDTIRDGATGLLANDPAEWPRRLAALVEDRGMLAKVAAAAHEEVTRDRIFAQQAGQRLNWYRGLWDRRFHLDAVLKQRMMTTV